jgi:hypothetical protein
METKNEKEQFIPHPGRSLIMLSMLAFSPFKPTSFGDVKLSHEQVIAINSIDAEMQRISGKYGSLTAISDPGDLLAYRWLAMAKDYVELGSTVSAQSSAISSIQTEMSNIVAKYGSLTAITDPGDLLAYRWLAMAKQYGQ